MARDAQREARGAGTVARKRRTPGRGGIGRAFGASFPGEAHRSGRGDTAIGRGCVAS
jgi:hypothetical protein